MTLVNLDIVAIGAQGDGIAEQDGQAIFVRGGVTGDRVEAAITATKSGAKFADIKQIIEPSPHRVEDRCAVYKKCGGCQLQHISDDLYANWITDRLEAVFSQHGFNDIDMAAPRITPAGSRRRLSLKALKLKTSVVLGFSKESSHQIVDVDACPVAEPSLNALFSPLRAVLVGVLSDRMTAKIAMTMTTSGADLLIEASKMLTLTDREALVAFAEAHDVASIHWQEGGFLDPVAIRREPVVNLDGLMTALPPGGFIQATDFGQTSLVAEVVGACEGYTRVADLFSGIGTFTFPLAKTHQVLAVEGAKPALDALTNARNQASKLKQIVVKHRDLYRRPLQAFEFKGFEAVVFDPPRAGAKEQCEELAISDVKRIVAVSCNPNTLARDLRILADGGYRLDRIIPIDQFLWSTHLEVVAVMTKESPE